MTQDESGSDSMDAFDAPSRLIIKFGKPVLSYAWHWATGYKLVLVGPSLGGKTRFLQFLYTLQLLPDHKNEYARAADRTTSADKRRLVVLKIGVGEPIVLALKAVVDMPGVGEGERHADLLADRKQLASGAHVVVIVLDGSRPQQAVDWITDFATRLTQILADAHKLCEIFVLVNKFDKCKSDYDDVNKRIADALSHVLEPVIKNRASTIKIFPTILIKHPEAVDLLNTVFQGLVFTLKRKARDHTFYTVWSPSP